MSVFQHLLSFITKVNNLYGNLTILAPFYNNSAENCRSAHPKTGKNASSWDLNLSRQEFSSSEINSSAVIFEKQKYSKIADFGHFEPLRILQDIGFAFKMLGIWPSFTCRNMKWGYSVCTGSPKNFTNLITEWNGIRNW